MKSLLEASGNLGRFDTDNDGIISVDEIYTEADSNKDGRVSLEELLKACMSSFQPKIPGAKSTEAHRKGSVLNISEIFEQPPAAESAALMFAGNRSPAKSIRSGIWTTNQEAEIKSAKSTPAFRNDEPVTHSSAKSKGFSIRKRKNITKTQGPEQNSSSSTAAKMGTEGVVTKPKNKSYFNTLRRNKLKSPDTIPQVVQRTLTFDRTSEYSSCIAGETVAVIRKLPDGDYVIKTKKGNQLFRADAFETNVDQSQRHTRETLSKEQILNIDSTVSDDLVDVENVHIFDSK